MSAFPPSHDDASKRLLVAWVSLLGGALIFAAKMIGWRITGSSAVFSDALESIVNVVAAGFAIFAVSFAAKPADRDHPYGHGKIEFIAAAFEGGLISFAAVMIMFASARALIEGPELRQLDAGLAITAGAGVANLLLGSFVLRAGRRYRSPTLVADGKHILSDVWTTVGVLVGLGLVRLTGLAWLDPIAAIAVGLWLGRTGLHLVREAIDALMDREDPELLRSLVDAFNEVPNHGVSTVHRLRAIRSGNHVHIDAHIFVPEHWTIRKAHEEMLEVERFVKERSGLVGELALHLDPCHTKVCPGCDLPACPIREEGFEVKPRLTVEQAVGRAWLPPHGKS